MLVGDLDVSLPQLRCFVAVVDAASLAEAGRRLGMSAASVSKAIVRLEQSTGARLLHRSTHALSLTPEGEALLEPARAVLAAALQFRETAGEASSDGGAGMVRISASVGFSRAVLAPLLAGFRVAHPDVQVDVRANNEFVNLADDGIDIALRSGPLEGIPGHVQQRWFSFPWIFCAAPAYLARRGKPESIEDLADHDLIGFRNLRTGQVKGGRSVPPTAGVAASCRRPDWFSMMGRAGGRRHLPGRASSVRRSISPIRHCARGGRSNCSNHIGTIR
jgi:DNA-binding transcriptional LysR family regulator